jgi:hypothetical protein
VEVAKVEDILTRKKLFSTNKAIHLMNKPIGIQGTSRERRSRVCHQIRTCLNFLKIKTHQKKRLPHYNRKITKMKATMTKRIMEIKTMMVNTARNSNKSSLKTQRNHACST